MKRLWVTCKKMTGQVDVDDKYIIIATPHIWQRFKGQRVSNLYRWLNQFGGFRVKIL